MFVISFVVVWGGGCVFGEKVLLNLMLFMLIGLMFVIFVGFCNNVSYECYCEGWQLWGGVLIVMCMLVLQVFCYGVVDYDDVLCCVFVCMVVVFVYMFKYQLCGIDLVVDLCGLFDGVIYVCVVVVWFCLVVVVYVLCEVFVVCVDVGQFVDMWLWMFDVCFDDFVVMVSGCECIVLMLILFLYDVLLYWIIYVYCVLLLFGFVDLIGVVIFFVIVFVVYMLIVFDVIVYVIVELFGDGLNYFVFDVMMWQIECMLFELNCELLLVEVMFGLLYCFI